MKRQIPGWVGWVGLTAWVIAFDLHPRTETMSRSFAPPGTHGRRAAVIVWLVVTFHLMRLLPEQVDPLRQIPTIRRKEHT